MSYILHIETATDICSVAISQNDALLAKSETHEANQHSSQLTLLIADAVKKANLTMQDLNAVALSGGPGSYTSLRVGSSVAKGICFALQIPFIAIDTLQSIAWASAQRFPASDILHCAMIDARRMEVYCAIYDHQNQAIGVLDARIIDEDFKKELLALNKKIIFSGNGAEKCKTFFQEDCFSFIDTVCDSSNMLQIAFQKFIHLDFQDVAYYSPTYFKAPNITTAKKVL